MFFILLLVMCFTVFVTECTVDLSFAPKEWHWLANLIPDCLHDGIAARFEAEAKAKQMSKRDLVDAYIPRARLLFPEHAKLLDIVEKKRALQQKSYERVLRSALRKRDALQFDPQSCDTNTIPEIPATKGASWTFVTVDDTEMLQFIIEVTSAPLTVQIVPQQSSGSNVPDLYISDTVCPATLSKFDDVSYTYNYNSSYVLGEFTIASNGTFVALYNYTAESAYDVGDHATLTLAVRLQSGEFGCLAQSSKCLASSGKAGYHYCKLTKDSSAAGECVCDDRATVSTSGSFSVGAFCEKDRGMCGIPNPPLDGGEENCGWIGPEACCTKEEAEQTYKNIVASLALLGVDDDDCIEALTLEECAEVCSNDPTLFDENGDLIKCKSFCTNSIEACESIYDFTVDGLSGSTPEDRKQSAIDKCNNETTEEQPCFNSAVMTAPVSLLAMIALCILTVTFSK